MNIRHVSYANGKDVSKEDLYQSFMSGFQDYEIVFKYSQREFLQRYFVLEGNKKEHSFVAYYKQQPVGIILGGIQEIYNRKTLHCGGFAVAPDYRGLGIGEGLFLRHKELGKREDCSQLLLEVLTTNESAIGFYEKQGYEKSWEIGYYSYPTSAVIENVQNTNIRPTNLEHVQKFHKELSEVHFIWKQHPVMLMKNPQIHYYSFVEEKTSKGMIGVTTEGEIMLLVTGENYRRQGVATQLMNQMKRMNVTKNLSMAFTPNEDLLEFIKSYGFLARNLRQYEMFMTLI